MPVDATSTAGSAERTPATPEAVADAPQSDDLLAVIAHSLLSSVALIVGGTELLSSHWPELPEERRTELLDTVRDQARYVAAVLDNLVRLGDPQLIEVLDGLQHHNGGTGPSEASGGTPSETSGTEPSGTPA